MSISYVRYNLCGAPFLIRVHSPTPRLPPLILVFPNSLLTHPTNKGDNQMKSNTNANTNRNKNANTNANASANQVNTNENANNSSGTGAGNGNGNENTNTGASANTNALLARPASPGTGRATNDTDLDIVLAYILEYGITRAADKNALLSEVHRVHKAIQRKRAEIAATRGFVCS